MANDCSDSGFRVQEFFHLRLHPFIHLDQRRPGALKSSPDSFFVAFISEGIAPLTLILSPDGGEEIRSCVNRCWSAASLSLGPRPQVGEETGRVCVACRRGVRVFGPSDSLSPIGGEGWGEGAGLGK